MKLDEAKKEIIENQLRAPYLSEWIEPKTNFSYVVQTHVILESNMEPHVIFYKKRDDPNVTWSCPAKEFFGGRFEKRRHE